MSMKVFFLNSIFIPSNKRAFKFSSAATEVYRFFWCTANNEIMKGSLKNTGLYRNGCSQWVGGAHCNHILSCRLHCQIKTIKKNQNKLPVLGEWKGGSAIGKQFSWNPTYFLRAFQCIISINASHEQLKDDSFPCVQYEYVIAAQICNTSEVVLIIHNIVCFLSKKQKFVGSAHVQN